MSCPDDAKVGRNAVSANLFITFHYTQTVFHTFSCVFIPFPRFRQAEFFGGTDVTKES